jgi:predicted transcriptional regulator
MSKSIMLSIQPQHFANIQKGIKHYEYRKTIPLDVKQIFLLGYVNNPEILHLEKEQLWQATAHASGIEKAFFDSYFAKKEKGLAIVVNNLLLLDNPKTLKDFAIHFSPQNFCYIK